MEAGSLCSSFGTYGLPRCAHIDYGTTGASVLLGPELEARPRSGGVPRRHKGVRVRMPRVQTPAVPLTVLWDRRQDLATPPSSLRFPIRRVEMTGPPDLGL